MEDVIEIALSDWDHIFTHLDAQQRAARQKYDASVGLILMDASWSKHTNAESLSKHPFSYAAMLENAVEGISHVKFWCTKFIVDASEKDTAIYIGEYKNCDKGCNDTIKSAKRYNLPCPPQDLPALAVVVQDGHNFEWTYLGVKSTFLNALMRGDYGDDHQYWDGVANVLNQYIDKCADKYDWTIDMSMCSDAVRIFVAGDRSSVGKSSVCLGLLSALMQPPHNISAKRLGYIKPATQSEKPQLIADYCNAHCIRNVPVGPLVYYRGFTRAFLAGETDSTSSELLSQCARAVDRVARGRDVVIVDGVGYPAVGSICGTDNAQVAMACSRPSTVSYDKCRMGVVIVGGPGVGAAVDAYHLNTAYFQQANIPILGSIFNKLPDDDSFYSLDQCREQITRYFELHPNESAPFGFVPLVDELKTLSDAEHFAEIFRNNVNVGNLLQTARAAKDDELYNYVARPPVPPVAKRRKIDKSAYARRSREEIEQAATRQGAKKSA